MWHKQIGPGGRNLARAYVLTGERRYAHKAAVLLAHIAAVYPAMDYDDAKLAADGKKKGYSSYSGSGFQHLFNVQKLQNTDNVAAMQWTHEKDAKARLRLRILPQPGQEVMLADARVSPVKFPQIIIEPFGDATMPHFSNASVIWNAAR